MVLVALLQARGAATALNRLTHPSSGKYGLLFTCYLSCEIELILSQGADMFQTTSIGMLWP
jgi:hypothetical protein